METNSIFRKLPLRTEASPENQLWTRTMIPSHSSSMPTPTRSSHQAKESREPAFAAADSHFYSKRYQATQQQPQCVTPPSLPYPLAGFDVVSSSLQTAPRTLVSYSFPGEESSVAAVTTTSTDQEEGYSVLPFSLNQSYLPLKEAEQQAACILWRMSRCCETASLLMDDNEASSDEKQQNPGEESSSSMQIKGRASRQSRNDEEKPAAKKKGKLHKKLRPTIYEVPVKATSKKRPSTHMSSNTGVTTNVSKKVKRAIGGPKASSSTETETAKPTTAPDTCSKTEPEPKTPKSASKSKTATTSKLITPAKTLSSKAKSKTTVVTKQKTKATAVTKTKHQTNKKSATLTTLTSSKKPGLKETLLRCNSNGSEEDPAQEQHVKSENVPDFLKNVDPYHIDEAKVPENMQQEDENLVITFQELNPNDVLMGRGNAIAAYPGNKRYRQIIRHYRPAYMKSYRYEKRLISQQVVTFVANMGGSFLEEVPGDAKGIENSLFRPITLERALEKISQACREKPPPNSSY